MIERYEQSWHCKVCNISGFFSYEKDSLAESEGMIWERFVTALKASHRRVNPECSVNRVARIEREPGVTILGFLNLGENRGPFQPEVIGSDGHSESDLIWRSTPATERIF